MNVPTSTKHNKNNVKLMQQRPNMTFLKKESVKWLNRSELLKKKFTTLKVFIVITTVNKIQ